MSKFFVIVCLFVIVGSVLPNPYTTIQLRDDSERVRAKRDTLQETEDINLEGKQEGTNQGVIATYWNNFLKRARLPLPSLNITNPLTNIFTPYVVEVDYPPENQQKPPQQQQQPQINGQPYLILMDPATQQYYKVQPVSS